MIKQEWIDFNLNAYVRQHELAPQDQSISCMAGGIMRREPEVARPHKAKDLTPEERQYIVDWMLVLQPQKAGRLMQPLTQMASFSNI